jgi:hypothetical protein
VNDSKKANRDYLHYLHWLFNPRFRCRHELRSETMTPPKVSEKLWQEQVLQLAKLNGWKRFHPLAVRDHKGTYRTALAGDRGFPDLVLARQPTRERAGGLLFVELKSATGRLSIDQIEWGEHLAPWAEWYLWRPTDINEVIERLSRSPK